MKVYWFSAYFGKRDSASFVSRQRFLFSLLARPLGATSNKTQGKFADASEWSKPCILKNTKQRWAFAGATNRGGGGQQGAYQRSSHGRTETQVWRPHVQRRNEVRWRPGQEASLALPCSNLRSFGTKCTVLKKVLVTLLGLFGTPRSDSTPPYGFGARELCPLDPPSLRPWVELFRTKHNASNHEQKMPQKTFSSNVQNAKARMLCIHCSRNPRRRACEL